MERGRLTAIFAKRPSPGAVKTRLCPPLAPEEAAELALAMLDDTVEACLAAGELGTVLRVAPGDAVDWFRERFPGVASVEAQVGPDLGARLAHHFAASERPGRTLVAIGTDAPHLGTERIAEAHRELASGADLVLGRDEDGGYHLVGLRRAISELFTAVPMSAADTCERTLALARSMGLAVALVAPGYDVDQPADLLRLARALADPSAFPPRAPGHPRRTARALARLVPDLERT